MVKVNGLFDDKEHIITEKKGMFSVVEHTRDLTVSPSTAMMEYFMSKRTCAGNKSYASLTAPRA